MFIHGICKSRLSALITHYKNKGLTSRVHKNLNTVPKHALSAEDTNNMLDFVKNYANKHCASSFVPKPDSKGGGRLLIMSKDHSKRFIHHKYKTWCSHKGLRAIALRSFQILWKKHLPYIVVPRGSNSCAFPETDLEKRTGEYLDSENHDDDDVALDFGCCEKNVSQSDLLLNETVTYSVENHTSAEHEPLFVNRGTSIDSVLSSDSADVHFQELANSTSTCFNSNAPDKLTPSEILVTIVPPARFCNSSEDNTPSDSLLPVSISLPQQPLEPKSILPDSNPSSQGIVTAETSESHLLFSHNTPLQSSLISDEEQTLALNGQIPSQPLFTTLSSIQVTDPTTLLPQSHDMALPLEDLTLADYQPLLLAQAAGSINLGRTPDWHPWTPFTSN